MARYVPMDNESFNHLMGFYILKQRRTNKVTKYETQHHNATSVTKYKKIHGRGFEKCCYWHDPIYQRITAAPLCAAQEHAVQP
jgi:hypothetical protein